LEVIRMAHYRQQTVTELAHWPLIVRLTRNRVVDWSRKNRNQETFLHIVPRLVGKRSDIKEIEIDDEWNSFTPFLTTSEQEVALHLIHGSSSEDICEALCCSVRTIRRRIACIRSKWNAFCTVPFAENF
jgi:DNA-directed RNA polymerase specialized sigma24 family protein